MHHALSQHCVHSALFSFSRDGKGVVMSRSATNLLKAFEVTPSLRVTLIGGFLVPDSRLLEILFHALSALVAKTEVMLRGSIPIVGGFLVPEDRLLEILLHARSRSRSQGYTALARELRQLQLSVPSMMRPACPARGAFL